MQLNATQRFSPGALWMSLSRARAEHAATTQPSPSNAQVSDEVRVRSAELFDQMMRGIHERTDRMFASLMLIQWMAAIVAAKWLSPLTWVGPDSSTHIHVKAAVFLGGAIAVLPVALGAFEAGEELTREVIAVAQMMMSALLIDATGGRIETHFHIFGSLAFLAFYRDWKVLITASMVMAIHHLLFGFYSPQAVYGLVVVERWRWLEHVGWVAFADTFLIISIGESLDQLRGIALRQAELEATNVRIEQQVRLRTAELQESQAQLKQSEAKFRKIFDTSQDIILLNRLSDGGFIDANPAFERRVLTPAKLPVGASAGEVRRWLDENRSLWGAYTAQLREIGVVRNFPMEFPRADGSSFPGLVSGSLIELDDQACAVSIVRDVTRMKQTESELVSAREAAEEAARQLQCSNQELVKRQNRLEQDLVAAREIQSCLLPRDKSIAEPWVKVDWRFVPCEQVGGDLFNVFWLDREHLGAYVIDVSGHGVPSAMLTVALSRSLSVKSGYTVLPDGRYAAPRVVSPREVLRRLEQEYPFERFNKFLSIAYLVLNCRTGKLRFSAAGHPAPFVVSTDGRIETLDAGGTLIGIGSNSEFEEDERDLRYGDRIFLYTDGIPERSNEVGNLFGMERLQGAFSRAAHGSLPAFMDQLMTELDSFAGSEPPSDDVTICSLEFVPKTEGSNRQ